MSLVLTSCTNRKRLQVPHALMARAVEPGEMSKVATQWGELLAGADTVVTASDLYCGRAFRQAELAAQTLRSRLMIVSAGLGLVAASRKVPAYSLTVVPGAADNILDRIGGRPSAADWWQALGRRSIFGQSIGECIRGSRGPVLVALSGQYLSMIASDLLSLPERTQRRLRIFSLSAPTTLHEGLRLYQMPYDSRFDGAGSPVPGTRGDFAQRALAHFAQAVLPNDAKGDLESHVNATNRILSALRPPRPVSRTKASDAEIMALIRRHWTEVDGRSGLMLRYLRDKLCIACEQSRFKDLFNAARNIAR